jgi:Flp pilus assembly protein TadD
MTRKTTKFIIIFAVIAAFITWNSDLTAAARGKLRVTVVDSKGKPVPGVKVTLTDTQDPSTVFTLTTNKKGAAIRAGLETHVFRVNLEKEGYQPIIKEVKILAGPVRDEKFTLFTGEEAMKKQQAGDPHARAVRLFNEAAPLIKQKKYDAAVEMLKKSASLDDTIYQSHYYLGVVYYEQEKYKEAVEPLKKVVELKQDYAQAYRLLAAVYEKLGDKSEFDKYTELAREKGGKTAVDAYNEGINAFNAGDTDKAIKAFEEAVKLNETFAEAHYQLGMTYLNKGLNDKAIACFEKFLRLKPDSDEAETAKSIIQSLK